MVFLKKLSLLIVVLMLFSSLALAAGYSALSAGRTATDFGAKTVVIIHYHRFDGNYEGWNLWIWPTKPVGIAGSAYQFTGSDAYGPYAVVKFDKKYTQVGFIVRFDDWKAKDVAVNRYINVPSSGVAEIWVLEGQMEYWTNPADVNTEPRVMGAFLDRLDTIDAFLSKNVNLRNWEKEFDFTVGGKRWPILKVKPEVAGGALDTNYVKIKLVAPLNTYQVAQPMILKIAGFATKTVYAYKALNEKPFNYDGRLGAIYSQEKTTFRVWSPVSSSASVLLFRKADSTVPYKTCGMSRNSEGVWSVSVPGDLNGVYYLYAFRSYGKYRKTPDIYSHSANASNTKSMVIDLLKTNPKGWNETPSPKLAARTDAVVYETSVRDFTAATSSGVSGDYRGKYMGFTATDTSYDGILTGLAHLKALGITDVQLLPIEDFWNVPLDSYNWGYVPYLYMVPEAQYSTEPSDPATSVFQVKSMIEALHKEGLGVILDISFSHTSAVGEGSAFDQTVPYYYYRIDKNGQYTNQSGVGNTLDTGNYMMRKYVLDTLKYWLEEYHVDGFRLDQLALINADTVKDFTKELTEMDPKILLYGEPWGSYFTYGDQKGMNIGFFNGPLYNAINGSYNLSSGGFSVGESGQNTLIQRGVVGEIDYDTLINGFALNPGESINYVSSHDGYTLWDRISGLEKGWTEAQKIDAQKLSLGIILTSQGIPFLYGGTEFARTKYGNSNSYDAPDSVNELKWSRLKEFSSLDSYVKGLIRIRKEHPAFRMTSATEVKAHLIFFPKQFRQINEYVKMPVPFVGYEIKGNANGDAWKDIIVLYNGDTSAVDFTLPDGEWNVVVDKSSAGTKTLKTFSGKIGIPPTSMMVLYRN